jgi:hypothetical protein
MRAKKIDNTISISEFKTLAKKGKIGTKYKGSDKAKNEFFTNLQFWCNQKGLKWEMEYVFMKTRKFRFDMLIHSIDIAIEWNGVVSERSRHLTLTGYSKDLEKINLAQINGFLVLQVTVLNASKIYQWIESAIEATKKPGN